MHGDKDVAALRNTPLGRRVALENRWATTSREYLHGARKCNAGRNTELQRVTPGFAPERQRMLRAVIGGVS